MGEDCLNGTDERQFVSGSSDVQRPGVPVTRVGFLAVGDEIVSRRIRECNGGVLASCLPHHAQLHAIAIVPDTTSTLVAALHFLSESGCQFIVVSGGLGPTEDDRTREALSAFLHVPLDWSDAAWANVVRFFAESGRTLDAVPNVNRRQAYLPRGSKVLTNRWGTACGILVDNLGAPCVVCLPGVPREFRFMLEQVLTAFFPAPAPSSQEAVQSSGGSVEFCCQLFGLGESAFESQLWERVIDRGSLEQYSICARHGLLEVKFRSLPGSDPQTLWARFLGCFGARLISQSLEPLVAQVFQYCQERGLHIGLVESCTGGALAHQVTALPGASAVLKGALVAYDRSVKVGLLNLEPDSVAAAGVYAPMTAAALARQGRESLGCDWVLSTTGVAGPGPDVLGVEEGVLRLGLASPHGGDSVTFMREALLKMFPGRVTIWGGEIAVDVKIRSCGDKEEMIQRMCQAAWVSLLLALQADHE